MELRRWMRDELGTLNAYELFTAIDIFVGGDEARNPARKRLHLGRAEDSPDKLADKIWHAAWDTYFLRWTDGGLQKRASGQYFSKIVLITGDSDPWSIRSRAQSMVNAETPEGMMALIGYEGSSLSPKLSRDDIDEIFFHDDFSGPEEIVSRMSRDMNAVFKQGLDALRELESIMGVQDSTVDTYRKYAGHPPNW